MSKTNCALRRRSGSASRLSGAKSSILLAAAAAAVPIFGTSSAYAGPNSSWADPAAVTPTIFGTGAATTGYYVSTVAMKDGDSIKTGPTAPAGLSNNMNYYVVGVGSTPSFNVKLVTLPGGIFVGTPGVTTGTTTMAMDWNNPANWTSGVPNGVDSNAYVSTNTFTTAITLSKDTTLGSLNFFGSNNDLNIMSTVVGNAGPWATLTFATSSGTPTVGVLSGKSLMFGDSSSTATNNGGRIVVAGNQGLLIDNQNPIAPTPLTTTDASAGAVKFGILSDWSRFTGTLTLARGAFASTGATAGNGVSPLPMNNDVVVGLGSDQAQLELFGNNGGAAVRGLDGGVNGVVMNNSNGGGPALTLGTYSVAGDVYNFQGSIGSAISTLTLAADVPFNLRISKIGAGTQILSGNNPYSNNTNTQIMGGKLSLGTTGTIGFTLLGPGQALASYPGNPSASIVAATAQVLQFHNGEFEMDGTAANPRIENFSGALIATNGTSAVNTYAQASNGANTITLPANAAQPVSMNFASFSVRNLAAATANGNANGSTFLFRGTNLGSTPGNGVSTITFTTNPLSAGQQATLGTTAAAVLKGALADTSATGGGANFATYDATNGIRPLNGSEQDTSGYPVASTAINTRLNLPAGDTPITGVTTQTLQLDNTSGSPASVTNSGSALNASAGILISGTSPVTLQGGTLTGTATTDNEDVVIYSTNSGGATIAIPITNLARTTPTVTPGWITYAGSGNFGANNQFTITGTQTLDTAFSSSRGNGIAFNGTGKTSIQASIVDADILAVNQGTVQLDTGASFSGKPQLQVAAGATFDLHNQTGASVIFDSITVPPFNSTLTAPNSGGIVTNSGATTVDLNLGGGGIGTAAAIFTGTITGNLNLILDKTSATLGNDSEQLTGANTYTGTTTIRAGNTLTIGRYGSLPVGQTVTLGDASTIGTLVLGDGNVTNVSAGGAVNQEVTNLVGNNTAAAVAPATNIVSSVQSAGSNASILTVNNPVTDTYNGVIGNPSATNAAAGNLNNITLRKRGAGTLILGDGVSTGSTAPNYYTGGTIIEGGILSVAADNKLGGLASTTGGLSPTISPTSVIANNININGGTLQSTGTFTLGSSLTAAGALPASQQAPPDRRGIGIGPTQGTVGGTGTIDVTAANVLTQNAPIANAGNTGTNNLVKSGTGTLALGGTNTYNGTTKVVGGLLNVAGTLLNNNSNFVLIADDPDGTFGTADDVKVTRTDPASFGGPITNGTVAGSSELGGLLTHGDLRQGANTSGTDTANTMQWRVRALSEIDGTSPTLPTGYSRLVSDVLNLTNMANSGAASGQTDPFAVQLNYDPTQAGDEAAAAAAGNLYLGSLDSGNWRNTVLDDFGPAGGSASTDVLSSYDAFASANFINDGNIGNYLGSWGVDTTNHVAWAIINHNSQLSVVSVPEPAMLGLAAVGMMGLLGRRRRAAK